MMFSTKDVLKIIDGLKLEDLKELSKSQHNSSGDRTLEPLVKPSKFGRLNQYSFSDLMLITLYMASRKAFADKEMFRHMNLLPSKIISMLKMLSKYGNLPTSENYKNLNSLNPFLPEYSLVTPTTLPMIEPLVDVPTEIKIKFASDHKHAFVFLEISFKRSEHPNATQVLDLKFQELSQANFKIASSLIHRAVYESTFDLTTLHIFLQRRIYDLKSKHELS